MKIVSTVSFAVTSAIAAIGTLLIVWGASDKLIPPVYGDAFKKAIKGAQLATIPKAGHLITLEQPDELISALSYLA